MGFVVVDHPSEAAVDVFVSVVEHAFEEVSNVACCHAKVDPYRKDFAKVAYAVEVPGYTFFPLVHTLRGLEGELNASGWSRTGRDFFVADYPVLILALGRGRRDSGACCFVCPFA